MGNPQDSGRRDLIRFLIFTLGPGLIFLTRLVLKYL